MKLLVISNMYPSPRKPHFGIFVHRRVLAYQNLGLNVRVVAGRDPRKGRRRVASKYAVLAIRSILAALVFRPDVIEGHYLAPTGVITALAGLAGRAPFILYAHGSDVETELPGTRWAVRRAAEIHTNSIDTVARIRTRFPEIEEAIVIPPGVDTSVFQPMDQVDPDRPSTVVFVGDLVRHKGVDVLLSALPLLEWSSWRCLIAGDGPLRSELEALAARLEISEKVSWMGEVPPDRISELFNQGDVAVVPSRLDAQGQVAIESLACGTPVVVSAVGGLASVPTADCGEAVPSDDPAALATAIERWLFRRGDPSVTRAAVDRAATFSLETTSRQSMDRLRAIAFQTDVGQSRTK